MTVQSTWEGSPGPRCPPQKKHPTNGGLGVSSPMGVLRGFGIHPGRGTGALRSLRRAVSKKGVGREKIKAGRERDKGREGGQADIERVSAELSSLFLRPQPSPRLGLHPLCGPRATLVLPPWAPRVFPSLSLLMWARQGHVCQPTGSRACGSARVPARAPRLLQSTWSRGQA